MSIEFEEMPERLDAWRLAIDDEIERIVTELEQRGPEHDDALIQRVYRWMRHYLHSGGKRVHGIVVVLAHQACAGSADSSIVRVAAGMQLYHHHTLVHDDIYDGDDSRRGWPTSHRAFAALFGSDPQGAEDEDATDNAGDGHGGNDGRRGGNLFVDDALRRGTITAFAYGKICRALAGHALVTAPFPTEARIASAAALDWHDLYDNAAQLADVAFEGSAMPSAEACLRNVWLKTGRLYEVCAEVGARLAGASESRRKALRAWAGAAAVAYQLTDDLEDIEADSEKGQGRGIGSDLALRKGTYLFALAMMLASEEDRATLRSWQEGEGSYAAGQDVDGAGPDPEEIIKILHRSGATGACRAEVNRQLELASAALEAAEPVFEEEVVTDLTELAHYSVSPAYWRRRIVNDPGRARVLLA